eukprot:jgi/Ulvmu1/2302/UM013_0150.1
MSASMARHWHDGTMARDNHNEVNPARTAVQPSSELYGKCIAAQSQFHTCTAVCSEACRYLYQVSTIQQFDTQSNNIRLHPRLLQQRHQPTPMPGNKCISKLRRDADGSC